MRDIWVFCSGWLIRDLPGATQSLNSSALTSCHSGGGEAVGGGAEGGLVGGPVL